MLIASDGSHPPKFTRSPIKFGSPSPHCCRPVLPPYRQVRASLKEVGGGFVGRLGGAAGGGGALMF